MRTVTLQNDIRTPLLNYLESYGKNDTNPYVLAAGTKSESWGIAWSAVQQKGHPARKDSMIHGMGNWLRISKVFS